MKNGSQNADFIQCIFSFFLGQGFKRNFLKGIGCLVCFANNFVDFTIGTGAQFADNLKVT